MTESKTTTIRLPIELCGWLAVTAETEHRSMNGQLIVTLEKAKKAQQ